MASTWAWRRPRSRRLWIAAPGRCTATIPTWPLTLDSKEPQGGYQDFIKGEVRYASLAKMFPEVAQGLFEKNEADAMAKYAKYKSLAE